jgi:pyruvate dehydrogenase E2 component (dihydrolipoamide acetyltransferase)
MATEVRLHQAGMGMTDGTVMAWLKDVGDEVRQGECIAEVEAAKTTVEIEAPCDGILTRILAPAGTLVPVREIMALIVSPGEPAGQLPAGPAGEASAEPAGEASAEPAGEASAEPAGEASARSRPAPPEAGEVQVVPAARRLAGEHGIPLTDVPGSGPGGRITEADVRARIEQGPGASVLPLAGTRGVIARRMLASLQGSAQYTLIRAVDVTALADWHDRGARPGGVTYADAVARAVVLSLAEHPNLNAHITGEQVRVAAAIDLGIGIDTDDGLVVGVLRNVGDLGLAELSAMRQAITGRVRAGRAGVAELQGSTFTISNLGSLGIDAFTPIINPPEVAILGVGRILDQPAPAAGGITWRKSMTLSLTVDHRAVDGAPAARFLAAVAGRLQAPDSLT